jgi:hypothetical protein
MIYDLRFTIYDLRFTITFFIKDFLETFILEEILQNACAFLITSSFFLERVRKA